MFFLADHDEEAAKDNSVHHYCEIDLRIMVKLFYCSASVFVDNMDDDDNCCIDGENDK